MAANQDLGQQRILRRLLTNSTGYVWHMDYGAGLGAFVGVPASMHEIEAAIAAQMAKEPSVSSFPEPSVELSLANSLGAGVMGVVVKYQSVDDQGTQVLKFTVPAKTS